MTSETKVGLFTFFGLDETGDHARFQHRHQHLPQCLERRCTKVKGRFIYVRIHLGELRQHIEHDVRSAECDMCQHDGQISLADVQEHEEEDTLLQN